MQSTHKIAGGSAQGFAQYLTSTSSRGDYYTGDGDEGDSSTGTHQPEGRWHGSPELLSSLGISAEEPVGQGQLVSLMEGRAPGDGRELRAVGGNGTRVAGVDVTWSAPKSVSALWAVGSPYERAQIEAAHSRAVSATVKQVERDVELVRVRSEGELRWEPAKSVLAAEFVHTSSRLTRDQEGRGVPDPQLHSHVVVLGAERQDGKFAAVDSRELFRSARVNGAFYRSELASELGKLGIQIEGQTGRDGRYFEVKDVPKDLSERWSSRSVDIERAAREFRQRYGRDPKGRELSSLTVETRGTKTQAAGVDVDRAWRAVGEEYGLTRERVQGMFDLERCQEQTRETDSHELLGQAFLKDVTSRSAVVSERDLRARAYEVTAGRAEPAKAREALEELKRGGELIPLEDGVWTTREIRELEQQTVQTVGARREEQAAPVSPESLAAARREAGREIGGSLSREQREALERITGRGGVSVLIGQAGTGKGVVLGAASQAWQRDGHRVIGTAIAGATAKRLEADAKLQQSLTTDALLYRARNDQLKLDEKTVVVMDEAGMGDTRRLHELTQLTAQSGSKLVLAGDDRQLPSIAAGGLFSEIKDRAPTAELTEVHRARNEWERDAWRDIREGNAERALGAYQKHERLHIADTGQEAIEKMLDAWECDRQEVPVNRTVMLTDTSNRELDHINALAQQRRLDAGELAHNSIPLADRPYDLRGGDEIIFTAAYQPEQGARVENGTLASILDTDDQSRATVRTREPEPRDLQLDTERFDDIRLAYAQHVYKAQGLTVDRAQVLTGGWQTNQESAYVALTRAREETHIHTSRDALGEQGMDPGAIERLGEAMRESRGQEASLALATETLSRGADHDNHPERQCPSVERPPSSLELEQ